MRDVVSKIRLFVSEKDQRSLSLDKREYFVAKIKLRPRQGQELATFVNAHLSKSKIWSWPTMSTTRAMNFTKFLHTNRHHAPAMKKRVMALAGVHNLRNHILQLLLK